MKKDLPFDKAVPPTSERFHLAMEYALDHLEEEQNVKMHTRMRLGMILALILALALMATAFALTNGFGILECFTDRNDTPTPLESAQALVQTDLGSAEAYGYRVSIAEAVYAGPNVLLMADVTVPDYAADSRSWAFSICRKDGGGPQDSELECGTVAADYVEDNLPEGVTYRVFWELLIVEEPPETVEVEIGVGIDIRENTLSEPRPVGDRELHEWLFVDVVLHQAQGARSAVFTADTATAADAGLEILSMQAQYTDLEAVVTIDYALAGEEAQGPFYGTLYGTYYHKDPTCSGMRNAVVLESTEGKTPCPVCVSNDEGGRWGQAYTAEGSPYSHLDPRCDLLEGCEPVPVEGLPVNQPCPHCWPLERRVVFHMLDGEGKEISVASKMFRFDTAYAVDADGRILRRQVLRMQTSE